MAARFSGAMLVSSWGIPRLSQDHPRTTGRDWREQQPMSSNVIRAWHFSWNGGEELVDIIR
jgi:hypothetical protein